MSKFIFVVGGVMSGVGKGTATASIGKILESRGFKVTAIKVDPYINVDAGTMNPVEHGEVFVTDDGDETDQDIGTYERFFDTKITRVNYMTTGRVYQSVIERERNLGYGGKCVEVVPHVPMEINNRIKKAAKNSKADFVLIEVGGTVGEYQNILFLEAARMLHNEQPKNVLFVLVSFLPVPASIGEMKTKPTQYAAHTLGAAGIQADFIIARAACPIDKPRRKKISQFCNVSEGEVIGAPDAKSVYDVPLMFEKEKFSDKILKKFEMKPKKSDLKEWKSLVRVIHNATLVVKIGVVGKYFSTGDFVLTDAYISILEALKHAAWYHKRKIEFEWINSEEYEKNPKKVQELAKLDGVLIPGGFGTRGAEGKIRAIKFVRENNIPYFGICYGMQLAAVEFGRDVVKLKDANTTEIDPKTSNPVIHIMPEQEKHVHESHYGGTMRLGAYPCVLKNETRARKAYGTRKISERHRHRYEFNNDYRDKFEELGMIASGTSPDNRLVEIVEIPAHPFFVGVQFHPEFQSRPLRPHPLFRDFIKAAIKPKK